MVIASKVCKLLGLITLLLAPAFASVSVPGFHSVEIQFFALAFFLMVMYGFQSLVYAYNDQDLKSLLFVFLFYLCACFFSLLDTEDWFRGWLTLLQYVPYFFVVLFMVRFLQSERDFIGWFRWHAFAAVSLCAIVILMSLLLEGRNELNQFLLDYFRISVNKIYTFCALVYCILLSKVLLRRASLVEAFSVGIIVLAVFAAGSRGSVLALAVSFLFIAIISGRVRVLFVSSSLVFFLILTAYLLNPFPELTSRFAVIGEQGLMTSERVQSVSRLFTAQVALDLSLSHPVNGVGMGNLSNYSEGAMYSLNLPGAIVKYWSERSIFDTTSVYLKTLAETGIIGLFLLIVVFYRLLGRVYVKARRNINDEYGLGVRVFIAVTVLHTMIDYSVANYYFWINIGAAVVFGRVLGNKKYNHRVRNRFLG